MDATISRVISQPGIKRDGTLLEGENYVDGQWVRFQRGLPRKIGGYRSINKYLSGLPRAVHEYTQDLTTFVHCGSAAKVERLTIDGSFNTSVITDRTPAGLTASANNLWQFDVHTSAALGKKLVAQVAPNLECICNSVGGQLFIGDLLGTAALTPITLPVGGNATGGIVMLGPYLGFFGTDGYFGWSVAGDPTNLSGAGSGAANVTAQKIIRGMPLRGGAGASPSALLWSADSLLRVSFVGGAAVFSFDTLSGQSSIMSSASVIEYDGIYYWVAADRFLSFNGVVQEVPNEMNSNYFFDNLNYAQRQKVFAVKVPRFGEIWWCYPHGNATECNRAIIYNVRERTWYDTDLPTDGRGAGTFPAVFRRPLMTSNTATPDGYKLWVHEVGTNRIDGVTETPIVSSFETNEIALPSTSGVNKGLQILTMEPDFVQSGDMTVQIKSRANARAPEVAGEIRTIPEAPAVPQEQVASFKEQGRLVRFRFESNALGGDYQMGHVLVHTRPADGTILG